MSNGQAIQAASEFLTGLFDRMQLSIDVEGTEVDGEIILRLTGSISKLRDPELVTAITQLTSSAASQATGGRVRCTLDVGGDLDRRKAIISAAVVEIADMVVRTGRRGVLDGLSPAERRLAHTALMGDDEVGTRSVGEGEPRTLLLEPAEVARKFAKKAPARAPRKVAEEASAEA
ncbi:MAG: protein jag [Bradymonadia bacterium]